MFNSQKKNKSDSTVNDNITAAVNQDLIIHNMPRGVRLSGTIARGVNTPAFHGIESDNSSLSQSSVSNNSVSPTGTLNEKSPANFKIVGWLIMMGGLIFIGILVYLSYIFIIKPVASIPAEDANIIVPDISVDDTGENIATSADPIMDIISTTTDLNQDISLEGSTSTEVVATGTEPIMDIAPLLPILLDSDGDGLSDQEELVFGTSATSADSDNDTYSDSMEISGGYNPIGTGFLIDNDKLQLNSYSGDGFRYSILSPKDWTIQDSANGTTIFFIAPDESFIQVVVTPNYNKASILNWYSESFPGQSLTYNDVKTTATWEGTQSSDGKNVYLTDNRYDNVLVISYIPVISDQVLYPAVFQMMINSLILE